MVTDDLCSLLPSPGRKSSRQVPCPTLARATPSSRSAKCTTCSEESKNRNVSTTRKISFRKVICMLCASLTIKLLSGPSSPAPETSPLAEPSIPPAKFKRIRCSSSAAATLPTIASTTLTISNYVSLSRFSSVPVVTTTQSKISWTSQKRYVQDRWSIT